MQDSTAQNLPQSTHPFTINTSFNGPEEVSLSIPEPGNTSILMSPEASPNQGRIVEAEQACFLRKTCIIIASMIIWIVMTIGEISPQKKLETMGLVAFCCLTYTLCENVIFLMKQNLVRSAIKQRLFDLIDGALALYFLLMIKLWNEEGASASLLILSFGVCLISVILYFRMAVSDSTKVSLIRGICYALQIALFAMKLQGYNPLEGITIFLPLGLYLTAHQIYGSYFLVKSSVRLYRQTEIEDLSFVRACLKMSYNVVHYGLVFIIFGVSVDLWHQAEETEIKDSARLLLAIMQLYSGLLILFAVVFFKFVREHDPELREDSDEENSPSRTKADFLREKYSLVPQDGLFICSFLKLSPTYFARVNDKNPQEMKPQEEEDQIALRLDEADEVSCYICEENQPDIIIMGCGHGGMCKKCVLLSMEKNSSCMQCRKPAQSIYQIKNEDKDSGIVEACEIFSIDY